MGRVLIAGCGDVGTALGLELAASGHQVVGLRRRPASLPAPIVAVHGDLASGDGLAAAAAGVTALVYTAAADGFSDEAYRRAYVDGLGNVLAALRAASAPLERALFTSSTAVYAQGDGAWVDETSPTEPTGFSGRRLLEAEALLLGAGVPATVLRLAGIYGPGRLRLIDEVRSGAATVPDGPPIYTNRIHVADCAGAIAHLLQLPAERAHGVWLGVDHEPTDRAVVLDWLADQLGVARPRRVAATNATPPDQRGNLGQTHAVADAAAPLRGRVSNLGQTPAVADEAAPLRGRVGNLGQTDAVADAAALQRGRVSNKRCRNAKLVGAGYVFRHPTFREGYAQVLAAQEARAQ